MEYSKYGIIILVLATWVLGGGFYAFLSYIEYAFPNFLVFCRDSLIPMALGALSIVFTTFMPT